MGVIKSRRFTVLDAMVLVAATGAGFTLLRLFLAQGMCFNDVYVETRAASFAHTAQEAAFPFLLTWTPVVLLLGVRRPRPPMRRLARQPGMAACAAATLVLSLQLLAIVIPEVVDWLQWRMAAAFLPSQLPQVALPYGAPTSMPGSGAPPPAIGFSGGAPAAATSDAPVLPGAFPPLPAMNMAAPPPPFPLLPYIPASPTLPVDSLPLWRILYCMHRRMVLQVYSATAIAGAWLTLILASWWRPERSWIDRFGRLLGVCWILLGLCLGGAPLLRWS
jgi:hypothetical protein